jgi:DNA-binding NtrC family response regulator
MPLLCAARILIADDDPVIRDVLMQIVTELGHSTDCTATAAETIDALLKNPFDLVLLDLRFPDCKDLSTLAAIREKAPSTDVIIVTAEADDLGIVTSAVRLGAFDYIPKPVREDDIRIRVTRVLEMRSLACSHSRAVAELARGREFDDIVGDSAGIKTIIQKARELSSYDIPVLITGETGTGKELFARALHYGGPRRNRPFVSINCAALPAELTESELFGHEKGAFTGAMVSRRGAFEEACDGTIFLDEIGDMNPLSQAALLHVLETGEYRSVGGGNKKSHARIVLATNKALASLVEEGLFRKDLFYRVDRMRIDVPPLRNRKEDIPSLARHFLTLIEVKVGKGVHNIAQDAMASLQAYDWPGNIRELKNELERAYIHADGDSIGTVHLSGDVVAAALSASGTEDDASPEQIEKLVHALKSSGGNISKAAEMLGVHRNTIHRWVKRYSLGGAG